MCHSNNSSVPSPMNILAGAVVHLWARWRGGGGGVGADSESGFSACREEGGPKDALRLQVAPPDPINMLSLMLVFVGYLGTQMLFMTHVETSRWNPLFFCSPYVS